MSLPFKLNIVLAIVAAIAVGIISDRRPKDPQPTKLAREISVPTLTSLEISALLVGMGLVTLGTRGFFMFLGDRVRMPELILRSIRYAPLAAIVAILAPEIVMPNGATEISQFNWAIPQIWAGLAAFVTFTWLRSMLPTLIVGMLVYSALRYWF
jgi:branched-subunit amino acid transport protein